MVMLPAALWGQSVSGQVRSAGQSSAIAGAEIALLDSIGHTIARTRSSDSGAFRMAIPEPGPFRLRATRLGYRSVLSPWMVANVGESLSYEFSLDVLPQALAPVTTTAESDPARIGQRFGLDPKNINAFVVSPDSLASYRRTASQLVDILRRVTIPGGLSVREEDSGEPCIVLIGRDRHCMLILVDDLVTPHVRDLDLSTIEDIVIMRPSEAGLWFGSLSQGGVEDPNQRSTAGGVLLIRTKQGAAR